MSKVSDRINKLSESATLAMARMSRELKEQGKDVISLSLGEPDFDTPEFIKEAAKEAIDNNFSHYTPVPGILDLRKSICKKFKRDNHLEYTEDQIVVSTGAKQSIANVCLSLLNPGDEVLLPTPYWVSYADIVNLSEAIPIFIKSTVEQDFKVSAQDIEKHITKRTKILMFSSPCNPSGSVFTRSEIEDIANVILKHPDIYIISDEIYEHINFTNDHFSIGTIKEIKDRVITVNGVSKGFAMTGWRVGFIGAPTWIAKACNKLQGQITSATCSIAQKATETAMLADPEEVSHMKETFLERRNLVIRKLDEIDGIKSNTPEGAFYLFPDVSYYFGKSDGKTTISNSEELCMYLLNNCYVSLVAGGAFGNPECIRISYAASEDKLIEAIERIKTQLDRLK